MLSDHSCWSIRLWSGSLNLPHERPFAEFIEELGPGQVVGRQVLASPCHGEIQVGLRIQQCLLEVEIVRARKLLKKALYTSPPGRIFRSPHGSFDDTHASSVFSSFVRESVSSRWKNLFGKATDARHTADFRSIGTEDSNLQRELSRQNSSSNSRRSSSHDSIIVFVLHRSVFGVIMVNWIGKFSWVFVKSIWTRWISMVLNKS